MTYRPLVSNPHWLTILANFWPRNLDMRPYPEQKKLVRTEPDVQVLVQSQRPVGEPHGELVLVHGLEGSGDAGYMLTMAKAALDAGFTVHRFNIRTCGGTERLANTLYHSGLTTDLRFVLHQMRTPVHLVGYSLGGNMILKLAGELAEEAAPLIASICAISTPIDLAACAREIAKPSNHIYERRFLRRMRKRVVRSGRFTRKQVRAARSIWEFDDLITGPAFGFRDAAHYYETQSARQFLERIRVPVLLVQAKDDIFVPFETFQHPAVKANPHITLHATERGGHLGFLSRNRPRFWLDGTVLAWIESVNQESCNESKYSFR